MAPQSGHPRGAQQTGRSAGPGWRDQARLCPQDVPQWPQGEYLLGGPGGCPPDVLGLHLSMGYGDPCPLLSGTRGPKSPLARLTAITWRLMASLGQLLRGQGNRRELQVLQLVGPELQKLLTKVRSFCKLTHQDRDAPPSRREQDASQAGRCGASSEGDGCYCGGSRKARRSVCGGGWACPRGAPCTPGRGGTLRWPLVPQGSQPAGQLVLLAVHGALAQRGGALGQLAELVQDL